MTNRLINRSLISLRHSLTAQASTYATRSTMDPQTVSELAKQEGGASKGSPAAQAQSQMTKELQAG